jgi:6-pyruvoyltetrahydropterin/6-carboxytetrahydropterin synthase
VSFEISRSYRFEAAHWLPNVRADHPCRQLHGHSYEVEVVLSGDLDPVLGWVLDFAAIDAVLEPLIASLDHRLLNEVEGLENPTSELLARWITEHAAPTLPALAETTVRETPDSRASYRPKR